MPLVTSFFVLVIAVFAIPYLFGDYMVYRDRISEPSAYIMASANLTNDLVHYTQALYSSRLKDFNVAIETHSFDGDHPTVTITHLDKVLQDAMYVHASVNLSYCEPMFYGIRHHPANDRSPNEEDQARVKEVIKDFVHRTDIITVEVCIDWIATAVSQHMYLQELHETTSVFVRRTGSPDLFTQSVDDGDRFYQPTAGVTYLSVMLESWAHETAGMREFLDDIREMLSEGKARVAKEAATRTGPFEKFKKALAALL